MWDEGRLEYGPDERQAADLQVPPIGAAAANGLAVLVHGVDGGGTAKAMEPLGVNLMAHGWVVANVEYRDGDAAAIDVRTALAEARAWFDELGGQGPLIAVGHREGAAYVLGAAQSAAGVVALDPDLDVPVAAPEGVADTGAAMPPVCLVVVRGQGEAAVEALEGLGATEIEVLEVRDLSRGLAIDPMSNHWPDVASWIHRTTGARSDPLGDKPLS